MYGSCNVSIQVINRSSIHAFFFAALFFLSLGSCQNKEDARAFNNTDKDTLLYLNHSDSARYVGMTSCRQCHQSIYNTYIETGMGRSFEKASKKKSSGDFSSSTIHDKIADFHYQAFWDHDSLFIKEFRLDKKDTTHVRIEQVNYIIGSGQHTNSHLQSVNGYVNQMPMTYYTQKKHWDLPPGFENGVNTRFSRKIGLECMSCHNAYPDFVKGSENKFTSLPGGIDCERCHGPGSIHVAQRSTGSLVDTSKYIDYSIVNPAKLSVDAQFDICQRCHLQGNAVLKDNHSFYDFKPGKKLSDFISVFLPKYKNADEEFIMASHADRLKQSACFIRSYEKIKNKNSLKPYKEALTCVTCHNPHVSVRQTNKNVFNEACMNCHNQSVTGNETYAVLQTVHNKLSKGKWDNCVTCHMPLSGSTDIPHVSVHDHYIRKPITQKEKNKIKTFIGLYSVNEKNPDKLTRAKAYIDQYEKFDQNSTYLDSALRILNGSKDYEKNYYALVQLYFIKQDFKAVLSLVNVIGEKKCYDSLCLKRSYSNRDAWAAYRIAESFYNTNNAENALKWFKRSVELAPYNLDFRNKLGSSLASMNDMDAAKFQFEFILKENPRVVSAYSNLGYINLAQGFTAEALRLYTLGEKLDPDNEALLLNLAGYYAFTKNKTFATVYLEKVLKKNPKNQKAINAMKQLNSI
jgi:nitrate/TMAO reductase-like tetraheme cytochrome c subunit